MSKHTGYSSTKTKETLIDEYINQGLSISQIARNDKVTTTIVRSLMRRYNIIIRPKEPEVNKEHFIELYKTTPKVSTVARKLNISLDYAKKLATLWCGFSTKDREQKDVVSCCDPSETEQLIIDNYTKQLISAPQIAKSLSINTTTVYNCLSKYNISRRKEAFYKQVTNRELSLLYETKSTYEIAEMYKVDAQAVLYALKRLNVEVLPADKRAQKCKDLTKETYDKIDNRDWLLSQRNRHKNEVLDELSIEPSILNYFLRKHKVRFRKTTRSRTEIDVCKFLTSENVKFKTNVLGIINNKKELDVYLPEHRIAIEINGEFYHNISSKRITVEYHQDKSKHCIAKGITLLHVWYNDWNNHTDIIKHYIRCMISQPDNWKIPVEFKVEEVEAIDEVHNLAATRSIRGLQLGGRIFYAYDGECVIGILHIFEYSNLCIVKNVIFLNEYYCWNYIITNFSVLTKLTITDVWVQPFQLYILQNYLEYNGFTDNGWTHPSIFYASPSANIYPQSRRCELFDGDKYPLVLFDDGCRIFSNRNERND